MSEFVYFKKMKKLKRKIEKGVEGVFFLSSTSTSIAVLLIILFIFGEGFKLFFEPPVEKGIEIVMSKSNPIKTLNPTQIRKLFDSEISNWKELGGKDEDIVLVRIDDLESYFSSEELGENYERVPQCITRLFEENTGMIGFFPENYLDKKSNIRILKLKNIEVNKFLTEKVWLPTAQPAAQLGVLPLFLGTLWVSLGAILFALPFGLAAAVYMAELAKPKVRNVLKPLIELLSGIPSVVYGFFGLVVIVPMIQKTFQLPVGETGLAGSIILGIMALPTIISISEDAIRSTPKAMKEASLALGASHWQTIYRVIVPYSISGISAAVILGIGRAIGETMAVLMVTGNAGVIPHTLLEPLRTIPATIAAELGESPQGGVHFHALFALGAILFIMTMIINLSVEYIFGKSKFKKSY